MSDWWAQRLGGAPRPPAAPQQYAVPQYQQPQQWQPQQPQQQQPQGPPKVTMHNLLDSMAHWQGGEGARNSARCPQCGSPNFFNRGTDAAPQCYDCGANSRFAPQGQPRG